MEKKIMLGNEAIARGAYEAGVKEPGWKPQLRFDFAAGRRE